MCDACVLFNNNSIKICVLMGSYVLMCLFVLVLRRPQPSKSNSSNQESKYRERMKLPRFILDIEDTLCVDMRELSHWISQKTLQVGDEQKPEIFKVLALKG